MSPSLLKIAAHMLDDYAERLGNAGCNDFPELEELMPDRPEREAFVKAYSQWNEGIMDGSDPQDWDEGEDSLPDFAVAAYLSSLIASWLDPSLSPLDRGSQDSPPSLLKETE